ncbi:DUF5906 domain-containing protein [Colwellia piezophila]|uniref:DUF5906 domain-containing protein n=1 Tax=Colwellia piezophila TaxID=211668 RepID=UPI000370C528|nr:DUF5906 domain-containing protein [Colwellia piezophila]
MEALEQTLETCLANDYCLETIQQLEIGEHVTYQDDNNNDVRVYRNDTSYGVNPVAWNGVDVVEIDGVVTLDNGYMVNIPSYQVQEEVEADFEPVQDTTATTSNSWRFNRFVQVMTNWHNGTKESHPYLDRKGIAPTDVDFDYRVFNGELIWQAGANKFQIIKADGSKKFSVLTEGTTTSAIVGQGVVKWVTEGFADAVTVNMATSEAVAIAGSDGALVACALKHKDSVIAGDKDPSKKIAKRAKAAGVRLIAPSASTDGSGKDWDEVRQGKGLEHVTSRLVAVVNSPANYVNQLLAEGWCKKTNGQGKLMFWNRFTQAILDDSAMESRIDKANVGNTAYILKVLNRKMIHAVGQAFRPDVVGDIELSGSTWANTFKPITATEGELEEGEADVFIELVSRVFPNAKDFKWAMGWLAHMLQKPHERPSIHPNIRSDHGIGKGVLVEIMEAVLNQQVVRTDLNKLLGNFSTDNTGCLLTFVDESKTMGTKAYQKLKGIMADNSINTERKYEQAVMENVYNRLMFSGNDKGVNIPIEQGDRRFYITEYASHKVSKEESQIFCRGAKEWALGGSGVDSIKKYLLGLNINYWQAHDSLVADTPAKRDYIDGGITSVSRLIQEYPHIIMTQTLWDNYIDSVAAGDGFSYQKLTINKGEFFESKLISEDWSVNKRWSDQRSKFMGRIKGTKPTGKRAVEMYRQITLLPVQIDRILTAVEIVETEAKMTTKEMEIATGYSV